MNNGLSTSSRQARIVCLEFTSLLLSHSPVSPASGSFSVTLFRRNLLQTIEDEHSEVTELAVKVLLEYATYTNDLKSILRDILHILEFSKQMMEERSASIMRWLCKYENPEVLFFHLASILQVMLCVILICRHSTTVSFAHLSSSCSALCC